jgi:hypothetical protein
LGVPSVQIQINRLDKGQLHKGCANRREGVDYFDGFKHRWTLRKVMQVTWREKEGPSIG